MSDFHIGDTGTIVRFTIKDNGKILDLTGATVKKIRLKNKDKTVFEKDLEFYTSGSDGVVQFVSSGSDFSQKGAMQAQAYIEIPDWQGHTSKVDWTIDDNFELSV